MLYEIPTYHPPLTTPLTLISGRYRGGAEQPYIRFMLQFHSDPTLRLARKNLNSRDWPVETTRRRLPIRTNVTHSAVYQRLETHSWWFMRPGVRVRFLLPWQRPDDDFLWSRWQPILLQTVPPSQDIQATKTASSSLIARFYPPPTSSTNPAHIAFRSSHEIQAAILLPSIRPTKLLASFPSVPVLPLSIVSPALSQRSHDHHERT